MFEKIKTNSFLRSISTLLFISTLFLTLPVLGQKSDQLSEGQKAVIEVIEESYIKGIKIERDVELIKKGFHPSFNMFALRNNEIKITSIDKWCEGVARSKERNPNRSDAVRTQEYPIVDITGNVAIVKVECYTNGKHIFTDYFSLYKFEEGWKIVAKVYYMHPR